MGDCAALELLYCATRITFPPLLLSLHSTKCGARVQNLHRFNLHDSADRDSERPLHTAGHVKDPRMHLSPFKRAEESSGAREENSAPLAVRNKPQTFHTGYIHLLLSPGAPSVYILPQLSPAQAVLVSLSHGSCALLQLSSFITLKSRRRCSDLLASAPVRLTSTLSLLPFCSPSLFLNQDVGAPVAPSTRRESDTNNDTRRQLAHVPAAERVLFPSRDSGPGSG